MANTEPTQENDSNSVQVIEFDLINKYSDLFISSAQYVKRWLSPSYDRVSSNTQHEFSGWKARDQEKLTHTHGDNIASGFSNAKLFPRTRQLRLSESHHNEEKEMFVREEKRIFPSENGFSVFHHLPTPDLSLILSKEIKTQMESLSQKSEDKLASVYRVLARFRGKSTAEDSYKNVSTADTHRSVRGDKTRLTTIPMSTCSLYSSSTPLAAFSGSDLSYSTGGISRQLYGDDMSGSDMSGYDRDRQRLKDIEPVNKGTQSLLCKKVVSSSLTEKAIYDREREEGRVLNNSILSKSSPTRKSNGIRSTVQSQRISGLGSGQESEEFLAMGTMWSPVNSNNISNIRRGSNTSLSTHSSIITTASNNSQNNSNSTISTSNGNSQRKLVGVAINTILRPGHSSSFSGVLHSSINTFGRQLNINNSKEDPKYPDPLQGASSSFQQRLMELASLEAETIRWERAKKVKKKPKQERDS